MANDSLDNSFSPTPEMEVQPAVLPVRVVLHNDYEPPIRPQSDRPTISSLLSDQPPIEKLLRKRMVQRIQQRGTITEYPRPQRSARNNLQQYFDAAVSVW